MNEIKVSQLLCYPIKGCSGIPLKVATLEERGIQYDRRWMLVDDNNRFISQRSHIKMTLIKIAFNSDGLLVSFEGASPLQIPFNTKKSETLKVSVWNDEIEAFLVGTVYDRWFSDVLGDHIRLVKMEPTSIRKIDQRYAKDGEQVSFADGYPYLILGQGSMDLLNSKLDESLEINRFRPNIVFTGGQPHEEDNWQDFSVANARFQGTKPCSRCIVTTIDQTTAVKGKEPLKTLSTYRKSENKILFGANLMLKEGKEIRVGDLVTVHEWKKA